jgi:hypothetical protein
VHVALDIANTLVLYVPALHFSQSCLVPVPVENVPMGHGMQVDVKLTLNIARYVPIPHSVHCVDPAKDAYKPALQIVQLSTEM